MEFYTGMYRFHPNTNFNYQLNRTVLLDGGCAEDIEKAAGKIHSSADWKKEMIFLGDNAIAKGRTENAIAYYRMSEFFMFDGDPDKEKYYTLATKLFYENKSSYFETGKVKQYQIPFEGVELPALFAPAQGKSRGTILLHGGNDSYLEELWGLLLYFSEKGYDTYIFEGPGQGGVLRKQGKCFTSQWEKPIGAVLDALKLECVTLIGMSLGGMLAPRAAAFDKRIVRVVAWSVLPSYFDVIIGVRPAKVQKLIRFYMDHNMRALGNAIMNAKIAKGDEMLKWAIFHGMYAYGAKTPFDFLKKAQEFQIYDIGKRVTQDVLLLAGTQDHMVNSQLIGPTINAFTNANSLTARVFGEKEDAAAHCNIGNVGLVCKVICNWMDKLDEREEKGA